MIPIAAIKKGKNEYTKAVVASFVNNASSSCKGETYKIIPAAKARKKEISVTIFDAAVKSCGVSFQSRYSIADWFSLLNTPPFPIPGDILASFLQNLTNGCSISLTSFRSPLSKSLPETVIFPYSSPIDDFRLIFLGIHLPLFDFRRLSRYFFVQFFHSPRTSL